MLLALLLYSESGFPLYKDTDLGRATTHQLYCFAIEVGFGANVEDQTRIINYPPPRWPPLLPVDRVALTAIINRDFQHCYRWEMKLRCNPIIC